MLVGPSIQNASDAIAAAAVQIYDAAGNIITTLSGAAPANSTTTAAAVTSTDSVILALNASRKKFLLANVGGNRAFIAYNTAATATLYVIELAAGATYESNLSDFTGAIHAICTSGKSTTINVTELS